MRRTGDTISIAGEYQYNAYHYAHPIQRFWHHAKYELAEKELDVRNGETVIDVGCGSGVLAHLIAKKNRGANVFGVDANPSAVEFCRSKHRLDNLEFLAGLVDELDFKPDSVDKIVFLEVIEHIYEDQGRAAIRSFHKILKPGGRLVVSTPNYKSLWPLIEITMDRLKLAPQQAEHQHVTKYGPRMLSELVESCGFKPVSKKSLNFIAPWTSVVSKKLAERLNEIETSREHNLGSLLLYTFEK